MLLSLFLIGCTVDYSERPSDLDLARCACKQLNSKLFKATVYGSRNIHVECISKDVFNIEFNQYVEGCNR